MVKEKKLLETLTGLYKAGHTYDQIAVKFGVSGGTIWKIIKNKYMPRSYDTRISLGLPILGEVVSVNGAVAKGSLTMGSRPCKCGRPFIPNHWSRQKCFICSPYKPSSKRGKHANKNT